jgi:FMN phosphatase YigB (HAD superfamily)
LVFKFVFFKFELYHYDAALDDPKLEAVLSDLYAHYENPASWYVAPSAKEAFAALRRGGVKVAIVSNWDTRLPALLRNCGGGLHKLNTVSPVA